MRRGTRFFAIMLIITILLIVSCRITGIASISDVVICEWFFIWLGWRAGIANDNEAEENEE
jgi:hypothetical protein